MVAVPLFVINLDRAPERWAAIEAGAQNANVQVTRIPAVDGKALPGHTHDCLDAETFRRRCGRVALPGEIGCYLSHRRALETFLATDADFGVILEDDITIVLDSIIRLAAIVEMGVAFDVIKLANHRRKSFIRSRTTSAGDRLGRTVFGPNGSAAAYLVSRAGAAGLLTSMATMTLPYDVDLERAWARDQNLLISDNDIFPFSDLRAQSSIASRSEYKQAKDFALRRIPTALFRGMEVLRRSFYAIKLALT